MSGRIGIGESAPEREDKTPDSGDASQDLEGKTIAPECH